MKVVLIFSAFNTHNFCACAVIETNWILMYSIEFAALLGRVIAPHKFWNDVFIWLRNFFAACNSYKALLEWLPLINLQFNFIVRTCTWSNDERVKRLFSKLTYTIELFTLKIIKNDKYLKRNECFLNVMQNPVSSLW